eukprot:NODE_1310_length_1787_cov_65.230769_g1243_i0.p1 GENE.NODE_1310_length_1787_cov_65.230769_g1243_i0~~NODE_1310_length_1787_cov_65.230769_g1243_i0.p1  ORF type:complete len:320 (+),score=33.07 NODE_1310_length_1787_cov_65.230769_g1243_i0:579-1538(+)
MVTSNALLCPAGGSTVVYQNNWRHMACTYDASNIKIYEDGTLSTTTAATRIMTATDGRMRIGVFGVATPTLNWFKGNIDEVLVWSRALSAAEITTLAAATVTFAGIYGDPHFRSFSGGVFEISGLENHVYAIISSKHFVWNMKFIKGLRKGIHARMFLFLFLSGMVYAGECGFRIHRHTITAEPRYWTGHIDGKAYEWKLHHTTPRLFINRTAVLRVFGQYSLVVKTACFRVILRRKAHRLSIRGQQQRVDHFNFDVKVISKTGECRQAHGLLGQTIGFLNPVHPTGPNGQGVIEGEVADYEVSDVLATDTPFNYFESE